MTTPTTTNGTKAADERPTIKAPSDDEKAALWAALDEAQESLTMAEQEVLTCRKAVSDACTAIVAATGKTGFSRKGQPIKFVKKKNSDQYFVRGQREALEEVDV
jgi:hypothetical protein